MAPSDRPPALLPVAPGNVLIDDWEKQKAALARCGGVWTNAVEASN